LHGLRGADRLDELVDVGGINVQLRMRIWKDEVRVSRADSMSFRAEQPAGCAVEESRSDR
jgi:hypothetical protein